MCLISGFSFQVSAFDFSFRFRVLELCSKFVNYLAASALLRGLALDCFMFLVLYSWIYIPGFIFLVWGCFGGLGLASRPRPGLIFLVLYSWLYILGFIFLALYSWFYIPSFILLVLYSKLYIPGLGMLWRPRPCFAASAWTTLYSWFYIPGSIFLVLYSWLCIPGFQISHFRFQIQISNFRFRSSDAKYCCFCMRVAENLVNTAVFACVLQKTL